MPFSKLQDTGHKGWSCHMQIHSRIEGQVWWDYTIMLYRVHGAKYKVSSIWHHGIPTNPALCCEQSCLPQVWLRTMISWWCQSLIVRQVHRCSIYMTTASFIAILVLAPLSLMQALPDCRSQRFYRWLGMLCSEYFYNARCGGMQLGQRNRRPSRQTVRLCLMGLTMGRIVTSANGRLSQQLTHLGGNSISCQTPLIYFDEDTSRIDAKAMLFLFNAYQKQVWCEQAEHGPLGWRSGLKCSLRIWL